MLALIVVIAHFWSMPWSGLRIAGLVLLLVSSALLVVARIQLGRAFSVRAKATTLITTGVYSRIRNPIYVFSGFVLAGAALWVGQPKLLLLSVFLIPIQVVRSREEAGVLEKQFGEAYVQYRRSTWF